MYLYNVTLQRATGITHAIHGNFSGTKQQEIIVSRGKLLELLRPDPNTGKVYTILSVEIFGVIRSLQGFRLTGDCFWSRKSGDAQLTEDRETEPA